MKRLLLITTALFGLAITSASADTVLTLTGPTNQDIFGPQSASAPCIISGQNCSNPDTFGFNNFTPNNATSLDRWSTSDGGKNGTNVADTVQGTPYTVGQIRGIVGNTFGVVIDVNTTSANSERLKLFEVWDTTTNTRLAHFDTVTTLPPVFNNGQGFGDYFLSGINFTGLNMNDGILFHAVWDRAVDGAESFWIQSAPVPGPIAGAGLPGLVMACGGLIAFARRRRKFVV